MLHQQIKDGSEIRKSESAHSIYRRKKWNKEHRYWHYIYEIVPPDDRRLLPTDSVLMDMMRCVPNVRLVEVIRDKEFDRFFVEQRRRGVLSTRAGFAARKRGRRFLSKIGKAAISERTIRPITVEAIERFLSEHSFTNIEWNGKKIIAYKVNGHAHERYESTAGNCGPYKVPLKKLHRLCEIEPPFFYGAALT